MSELLIFNNQRINADYVVMVETREIMGGSGTLKQVTGYQLRIYVDQAPTPFVKLFSTLDQLNDELGKFYVPFFNFIEFSDVMINPKYLIRAEMADCYTGVGSLSQVLKYELRIHVFGQPKYFVKVFENPENMDLELELLTSKLEGVPCR